ncbi:hypothetical protein D9M72_301430 [compost metagenome]
MADQRNENHDRYIWLMSQVKLRLRFLESDAERMAAPPELPANEAVLLYERVCLQLRKILELIAYSTLVANKDAFATSHPNFAEFQKAKNVLNKLRAINPRYYPAAMRETTLNGKRHFEDAMPDTWLTEDEFAPLFDSCSEVLHVANPFDGSELGDLGRTVPDWIARIRGLLQVHVVALTPDDIILVQMHDWSGTNVELIAASAR